MSENKSFQVDSNTPSPRRAASNYQAPTPAAASKSFKWAPGFEQNQAPQGSTALPNLPVDNGIKPFRVR